MKAHLIKNSTALSDLSTRMSKERPTETDKDLEISEQNTGNADLLYSNTLV